MTNRIFVFGSNEAGIHGAGAALYARKYMGALQRIGNGRMGSSYAIPTKDREIRTLPIDKISAYVNQFKNYAASEPDLEFQVTRIGCGLAGLLVVDIAPLFEDAPSNCLFDRAWEPYISNARYWGTF